MNDNLKAARSEALSSTSPMYRAVKERAYDGVASPRAAIRAFCLSCTGDSRNAVRDCTSYACPLREYRPYQTSGDVE